MKYSLIVPLIVASFVVPAAFGAEALVGEKTYPLWPHHAPKAEGEEAEDVPAVQVFLPAEGKATGASIVVCPGGGYQGLAKHESGVVGKWLADNGVTAFVLRYRLAPKYHHPVMLIDAQRAIRFVRFNAKDWNLDPARIGILGFSAGGHLAASAATHFAAPVPASDDDPIDQVSPRPDVQILIYPVITMTDPDTHKGSRKNLLGDEPAADIVDLMSNEKQVTAQTPPAFLVHSTKDATVPVSNADAYAAALKANNVEYQFVRGEHGGHGFGLKNFWTGPCVEWLRARKF